MKFQSQFRFLVCVGILSGCSQATREPHNGGGGGGGGGNSLNNFNLKPKMPTGSNVLGVQNVCNQTIWVETSHVDNGIPTAEQLVKIAPGQQFNYDTSTLKSLKLSAKFGCDSNGNNCTIGQQYNPCPTGGCPGSMDTIFEADNTNNTYYDISLVDGFTAPMKVVTFNGIGDGTTKCGNIDASSLNIAKQCPTAEDLSTPITGWTLPSPVPIGFTTFGDFTNYTQSIWVLNPPQTINLQTPVGLQAHAYNNPNQIIACLSPGHKLSERPAYGGFGVGQCQGNQCNSANTVSGTPAKTFPDIAYSTNPPATAAVPAAYDARLVMYLNPYNGCDLTQGTDTAKPNGQTNCQGGKPHVNYNNFASPQNTLSPAFGFTQLINFCTSNNNQNTSPYCNDYVAASQGIPVVPGNTIRSTAAAFMGRLGPIVNTNYVKTLHAQVPGVYTWQYDDANALNKCLNTSSQGQFKMVVQIGCIVNK